MTISGFGKGVKAISYTVASPGKIAKLPNKREDKKQEQGSTLHGVAISQEFKDHKSTLKEQEFTDNILGLFISPLDGEPSGFCFTVPPKPLAA